MLDDHLESPVTRRRLRAGPAAAHLDAFADRLHAQGYARHTISCRLRSLARWTDWMRKVGLGPEDLVLGFERYREHMDRAGRLRSARGSLHASIVAASALVRFLREQGVLEMPAPPSVLVHHPILVEFRAWMTCHRGVASTTLDQYQRTAVELLDALGGDTPRWTASALRTFVIKRVGGRSATLAQCVATAVRAFLRFLSATARGPTGMEFCIPPFARWKLATTPRFIEPEEVERLIATCQPGKRAGSRDRAVILLLARLGLRASDVAHLSWADIDWENGRLSVTGKGRRQEWLPLPTEIGEALVHYLENERPRLNTDRVFITTLAPLRPLTRAAVSHVVRAALQRAGVDAPTRGAHLLRHSAATAMLRNGASLAGVGAVLRHRSPSTTAHYAKVDFALLREIAQPWPEVSSC